MCVHNTILTRLQFKKLGRQCYHHRAALITNNNTTRTTVKFIIDGRPSAVRVRCGANAMDERQALKKVVVQSVPPHKDNATTTSEDDRLNRRVLIRQIFAACITYTIVLHAGINLSFSAIQLPQLNANDSTIEITKADASWIASLLAITLPVGSLCVGPLLDRFGRRAILLAATLPIAGTWTLCALSSHVVHLYVARICGGISSGLTTACIVYVTEMANPQIRGMLLNCNSVFVAFGILLLCFLGAFIHWKNVAWIASAMAWTSFAIIWWLPESPHWLYTFKNDQQGARKALSWYYTDDALLEREFLRVKQANANYINTEKTFFGRIANFLREARTTPSIYKPTLIIIVIFLLQQLTGIYVIVFYAVDIFNYLTVNSNQSINPYMCLIILGVIRFGMSTLSAVLGMRLGRKLLMCVSAGGMALCALIAAINLQWFHGVPLISVGCILGYVCFGAFGVMVVPWTLVVELLPTQARGKISGLTISVAYVYMFVVVKLFPYIIEHCRYQTIFFAISMVNCVYIMFVIKFLPETFRKTLAEIQEYFN